MPTGYTASIKDGISFNEYALGCARAFGVLVLMRDEPSDAEIPQELIASDYHAKKLSEEKNNLFQLGCMINEEVYVKAEEQFSEDEKRRVELLEENKNLKIKYVEMLELVNKWKPPTKSHEGLHSFMRKQIEESINFDCDVNFYKTKTKKLSGDEWLMQKKEEAIKSIKYHEKENKAEIERTTERNLWLKNLRDSLTV